VSCRVVSCRVVLCCVVLRCVVLLYYVDECKIMLKRLLLTMLAIMLADTEIFQQCGCCCSVYLQRAA
jgi:hypothetical protein